MSHRRTRAVILAPLTLSALGAHGPTLPAQAAAVTGATASASGLQLALHIPDGPYFLSEVLPVSITLTNRSGAAIQYAGSPAQALGASLSGGTRPFLPPVTVANPHGAGHVRTGTLGSGQSIVTTALLVVSASGRPAIRAHAQLTKGSASAAPFSGHPPSVTIAVAPTIPFSRMLGLRYQGHMVRASGPAAALAHLEYQYALSCAGTQARPNQTVGGTPWQATGASIREPACGTPGQRIVSWYVVVGAPGYAVTTASYCTSAVTSARMSTVCKQPGAQHVQL